MNGPQPPVLFADSVKLVTDIIGAGYAEQNLDVTVDTVVPNQRPDDDTFVVVRRAGGPQRDIVTDEPLIVIESYAPAEFQARANLDVARAYVKAARGTVWDGVAIYSAREISGPADLPDPVTPLARSTATWQLGVRGRAL